MVSTVMNACIDHMSVEILSYWLTYYQYDTCTPEEIWLSGLFHHSSEQWLKSGCTKHNMTHYAFSRSEHWSWSSGTGHWLQAWFCTQKAVQTQCNSSAQTVLDNVPYMHVLSAVLETQAGGVTLSAAPSSSSHVRQSHVQSSICTSDAACINRHV